MILVHAAPRTLEPYRRQNLGVLCSPRCVYGPDIEQWTWAADNDAYSQWNPDRYRRMLERIWGRKGCLFVTAPTSSVTPNAPSNCSKTGTTSSAPSCNRSRWWRRTGSSPTRCRGSASRRCSSAAPTGSRWARPPMSWCGRRGGVTCGFTWAASTATNAFRYAKAIGCDSVDGTSFSWWKDRWLRDFLDHAAQPPQGMLT